MNKLFVTALVAAFSTALMMSAPAVAQDWSYDSTFTGNNDVDWNVDFTETEDWTFESGATFDFGGGAGSDGEANANGDFSYVGGNFGQSAWGTGDAAGDTNGNNYAVAQFHSASNSANGGYAGNTGGSWGDWAELNYDGIVTAGGAGSINTGLTFGAEHDYSNTGFVDLDYSLINDGSFSTP